MINEGDLRSILGKNIQSSEMIEFEKKIPSSLLEGDSLPNEVVLDCYEEGISLLFEDNKLSSVHMYCGGNKNGFSEYNGWIGDQRLSKLSSSEDVVSLMGEPNKRGGGDKGFMGRIDAPWLRYDFLDYVLHYTFSDNSKIMTMVTLMTPESAP
jgi:hypothetical protein